MQRCWVLLTLVLLLAACGTPAASGVGSAPATTATAVSTTSGSATATATGVTTSDAGTSASAQTSAGTSASAQTSTAVPASTASSASADGQALFVSNGCQACHGEQAKGGLAPALAGTGLSFTEVLTQVRAPKGTMPPFSAQQVSDAQVQAIYAYLESLGPPTPTPAPTQAAAASAATTLAPPNVDAIANAVDDLKVASDYAHDAAKSPAELHTYAGQAATALQAAQQAIQSALAGGGGANLRADLQQLQQQLDKVTPDVQAAAVATTLAAAEPHTAAMQLASRLDLLPLAIELLGLNGETGTITGTVRDTAGKPVAQAFVTIGGGAVHTGLMTDANGNFQAGGIGAFRSVEVKAYKAGDLYVEGHAKLTKGGTANVVLTIPPESNPPASPKVSAVNVALKGTTASFSMKATQKDNRLAPDQIWALSPEAGVAYVLRSTGGDNYSVSPQLPALKPGPYTWYFFATTHECDMSNVIQQRVSVP